MKSFAVTSRLKLVLAALALTFTALSVNAGTRKVWTGTTNANWSVAGNWSNGIAPIAGDTLVFDATGVGTRPSTTNDFAANTSFGAIYVQASGYVLGGTNSVTATGGLIADTYTGRSTVLVPLGGTTSVTMNTVTGRLTLAGSSSFTGNVNILAGTLVDSVTASAIGTGTINLGNTSGSANASFYAGTTFSLTRPIVLASGTTGKLIVGDTDGIAGATFTGGVTGTNNLAFNPTGGSITFNTAAINISGTLTQIGSSTTIISGIGSGITSITQNGAGQIAIASAATLSGNLTLINSTGSILSLSGITGTGNLTLSNNSSTAINLSSSINNTGTITNVGTGSGGINITGVGNNVTDVINNSGTSKIAITSISVNTNFGTHLTNNSTSVINVLGTVSGSGTLTLSNNGTASNGITLATVSVSGVVVNSGTGSGSVSITGNIGNTVSEVIQNSSTSPLVLSGANSFTSLAVKAGIVVGQTSATAFGAGNDTLGNTTGTASASLLGGTTGLTFANPIVLATNPTVGALMIGDTLATTGTVTFSGGVTGSQNLILDNSGSGSVALKFSTSPINNAGTITNTGISTGNTSIGDNPGNGGFVGPLVTQVIENSKTSGLVIGGINVNTNGTTLINLSNQLTVLGFVSGSGNLTLNNNTAINSGLSLNVGPVNNTGTITNSGIGSGQTSISSVIGSAVKEVIQKSRTSPLVLGGANTFASLAVKAGLVMGQNNTAFGAGNDTLGDDTGTASASLFSATSGLTFGNPIILASNPTAGTLTIGDTGGNGFTNFNGSVTGSQNLVLDNSASGGSTLTFFSGAVNNSGTITNNGTSTGLTSLRIIGSNVTNIIENSATSPFTVATIGLTLSSNGPVLTNQNLSGTTGILSVTSGVNGTGDLVLNNNGVVANGITISGNTVSNIGRVINSGTGSGSVTISSNINSSVTGVLQNSSTSTLALSGTNTFSGTNIIAGSVNAQSSGALGTASVALGGATGTAPATLMIGASVVNVANPIVLTSNSNVGALTLGDSVSGAFTFSGGVTGPHSLFIANRVSGTTLTFSTAPINISGTITYQGSSNSTNINCDINALVTGLIENGSSSLTLNGSDTISGDVTIAGSSSALTNTKPLLVSGNWINNGNFVGNGGPVILNGSSPQSIGGSHATSFSYLIVNNTAGVTIATSPTVAALTLANGSVTTGANKISIGSAGSVIGASATRFVKGNLQRSIPNTASHIVTFDVGEGNSYRPITVAFTGTTTGSGSLTAASTLTENANNTTSGIAPSQDVNGNWTLTNNGVAGFSSFSTMFNWPAGDVDAGAPTANFSVKNFVNSAWTSPISISQTPTSIVAGVMTTFGNYKIGALLLAAPTALSYATPVSYNLSTAVASNPTVTGTVTSYTISPDITANTGLSFNTTTGVISGTPTILSPATDYTVTATNNGGSTTAIVNVKVNVAPPSGLSYASSPAVYTSGTPITPNIPTVNGTVTHYSASLPAGLTIDSLTGVITGTPAANSFSVYIVITSNYTIIASNSSGSQVYFLKISVKPAAPSGLSYASNPVVYTAGTSITDNNPSVMGIASSYTIFPDLTAATGLSFDPTTGVISGTPTSASPATDYTVAATNGTGSTTALVHISVNAAAPTALSYISSVVYTVGTSITSNNPTVTGTVSSYSISPDITANTGLKFNTTTGAICGTPTLSSPAMDYTVTATNNGGSTTAVVNVTVNYAAPTALSYTTPVVYTVGTAITANNNPKVTGIVSSYAIFPDLTAATGLSFDPTTGVISGTPTSASTTTDYTVAATNGTGSTTALVHISVNAAAPTALSYISPVAYTVGTAITDNDPMVTGAVTSYSISPDLTANTGLTFNTSTGVISGTPTAVSTSTAYTITASNISGSITAALTITVNYAAPTALSYISSVAYTVGTYITSNNPTVTGTVSSYSISPDITANTGLKFNTTTGAICGTPTLSSVATTYTVTATNNGGSTTATLSITVNYAAPSVLSYTTPVTYTVGTLITLNNPTIVGMVSSYTISPSLPAGLSLDGITGVISGTPTISIPMTDYTVTATNNGGSTTATVSITVNYAAPTALSYTTPVVYTVGAVIANNNPTVTGTISSYTISPDITANTGLKFNTTTGAICGTPTLSSPATDYTVTATNNGGSTTATVSVTVNYSAPTALSYTTPVVYTVGAVIANNPTVTGTITHYSITPILPVGIRIDSITGAISGTPTAISPAMIYTVTATNNGGSATATLSVTVNYAAPAALSYTTPIVYTVGTLIANNNPTVTGTISSYTISPDIMVNTGLTFNTTTGAICGTPTLSSPAMDYTVIAINNGGSTTAVVNVTVNYAAPTTLSYSPPVIYTAGMNITSILPVVTGTVAHYSVSPVLPAGLVLDPNTGALTGTPTGIVSTANYTITATNNGGSTTAVLNITVNYAAPAALSYTTPVVYTVGTTIIANNSTVTGTVSSYAIAPALPTGLVFNTTTGVISGTPTAISPATVYTVTATNNGGSTTAAVSITVNYAAPTALSYTTPVVYAVGTAIAANNPTVTGTVTRYSILPVLSTGLKIDSVTGILSGTPTAISPATVYTVTATNNGGSTTATLSITVNYAAPTALSYTTPVIYTLGVVSAANHPVVTGTITHYFITPVLSAGIKIDSITGIISGTPTAISPIATYTVTASNNGGSTTATLKITVNYAAPIALSYTTPVTYTVGTSITANTPTVTGTVTSYAITPALPTGLAFNTTTGVISGTPTGALPATVYTITASNNGGSTTATVSITILNPVVILYASKDAFLRGVADNTNEGANPLLRIEAAGNNRAIVGFNLTGVSLVGLDTAWLQMTIEDNADNWGNKIPGTRYVEAHRILTPWVEGNGANAERTASTIPPAYRGDGTGVTWDCPGDTKISNSSVNGPQWQNLLLAGNVNAYQNGGAFAAATAPSILHYNDLIGPVRWRVTADLIAGATNGWLIKKQNEDLSGRVYYYSREGAAQAGHPEYAPSLILVYHAHSLTKMTNETGDPLTDELPVQYMTTGGNKSLHFGLPDREHVIINIYDIQGHVLSQVLNQTWEAGDYRVTIPAELKSPYYLLDFRAGNFHKTIGIHP